MQKLEHNAYLSMTEGAELIEQDGFGPKVYLLADGTYLKLFRRKRRLSSALLFPYAKRFVDNLRALQQRDIPCPQAIALWRIPAIARDAVHYRPLAGQTIRGIVKNDAPNDAHLREKLGRFVGLLHARGVYFRSLHLGNIVLTPEGTLGLIDVADMRVKRAALNSWLRRRNRKPLRQNAAEAEWLFAGGSFEQAYSTFAQSGG